MAHWLQHIADDLPNGLHDTLVSRCRMDFENRTLELDVSIWVGDPSEGASEVYRAGRLVLEGLYFCQFEPPSPGNPFAEPGRLRIDLCDPDLEHPLAATMPPEVSASRLFVSQWNAFIVVAARSARLVWLE